MVADILSEAGYNPGVFETKHSSSTTPFLLMYRSSARQEAFALALLLLILCLFRLPALSQLGSAYLGGAEGDGGLYIWLTKSNLRDLGVTPWFSTSAFYPYGMSLAWSDCFILPSLVTGILIKVGFPFIVAYNLTLLLANLLNGYCTYRLVFKLGGSWLGAIFGAALFMCYSYLGVNLGHPQLQFAFFIPLALSAMFDYVAAPAFMPPLKIGAYIFLAFLSAAYYALFTLAACGSVLLAFVALHPRHLGKADILRFVVGGIIGILPLVFFISPYLAVKSTFGQRGLYEAYYFSASIISYLSSSPLNFIYGGLPFTRSEEENLFPGFTLMVLGFFVLRRIYGAKKLQRYALLVIAPCVMVAIFSLPISVPSPALRHLLCALSLWAALGGMLIFLWRMGRLERLLRVSFLTDRDVLAICLLGALAFLAISFGPLGNPEKGQWAIGPFALLHTFVPGFDALRAVSRAGLVSVFFLIVACSLFLSRRMPKNRRFYAIPLLLSLGLLENFNTGFSLQPLRTPPPIFAWLKNEKVQGNQALAILPLTKSLNSNRQVASWGEYAAINTNYMLWAFDLERPLLNGYSGMKTNFMRDAPRELADFPDKRSLVWLHRIAGVEQVLYLAQYAKNFDYEEFKRKVKGLGAELTLIREDAKDSFLFELGGETKIDSSFYLQAPSSPPGRLELDVIARGGSATLEVHLKQVPGAALVRKQLSVENTIEHITLALPQTGELVRPLQINFSVSGTGEIFLIKSRFTAG